jgi:transcriptional regulator with XRE-family HTH domain
MMAIPFDEILSQLAPERRAEVEARAAELIAGELNLREVRESVARSQAQVAEALGVEQAAVSRLERRADMYVSTLRKLLRAMGGELVVIARFPGRDPVRIVQFGGPEIRPGRRGRKKKSAESPIEG